MNANARDNNAQEKEAKVTFQETCAFVWRFFRRKPFWLTAVLLLLFLRVGVNLWYPYLTGELIRIISMGRQSVNGNGIVWLFVAIGIQPVLWWALQILKHIIYD